MLRAVLRVHLQPVVPDIAGGWVHGQVGRFSSKGEKLRAFWARKRKTHGSEDLAHFLLCHLGPDCKALLQKEVLGKAKA